MTKNLADMTAEERAECVGMWANVEDDYISVIAEVNGTGTCVIVCPARQGCDATYPNEMVTPRYDLPRAWTPNGEPVGVSKEYGLCEIGGRPDGAFAIIVHVDGGSTEYAPDGTPHGEVYRWVGEWEQVNE